MKSLYSSNLLILYGESVFVLHILYVNFKSWTILIKEVKLQVIHGTQ